jgi:hypothetical protein
VRVSSGEEREETARALRLGEREVGLTSSSSLFSSSSSSKRDMYGFRGGLLHAIGVHERVCQ